jgi:hypothetical protein
VARRAARIASLRDKEPDLLLLSAGDFYAEGGILEMYRSRFLASMMVIDGYDAAALGENELAYDLKAATEDAATGLPIICANLYAAGERIFPPYVVKSAGKTKVGIFALLGGGFKEAEGYEVADPVEAGREAAGELKRRGCDLVILLAHIKRDELEPVVRGIGGVDLVIRGHTQRGEVASSDCADTTGGSFQDLGVPVLYSGDKGRALGLAVMSPAAGGAWELTDTTLIGLPKTAPQDSMILSMLRRFHREDAKRRRELQVSRFLSRDPVTGKIKDRYLGIEICARCHDDIVSDFILSPHFRTFKRLTESGNETNEKCIRCHVTGYGRYTGYDPESESKGGINLRGVQCEACHGPGTKHSRDGKYRENARSACRSCHDAEKSPHFAFQTFWARVGHRALADSAGAAEAHR